MSVSHCFFIVRKTYKEFLVPPGFEPRSPAPEAGRIGHYPRGLSIEYITGLSGKVK